MRSHVTAVSFCWVVKWIVVQIAAGDGQTTNKQAEIPSYVDCQTNIMRLTKQVAQTVQEMVSFCAASIYTCCWSMVELP